MDNAISTTQQYTLVVVDMQPGFSASNDQRTIAGVQQEILDAMQLGMPIIIVESTPGHCFGKTHDYGATHPCITDLLRNYDPDRWSIEHKGSRDYGMPHYRDIWASSSGGLQVHEACEVFEFPTERFRVCGVNTDICVFFTAMELSERLPRSNMQIVLRASNVENHGFPIDIEKTFGFYAEQHGFSNYELVDPV